MSIATESPSTVVVAFEERHLADLAVDELRRAGFREDRIRVEESPILRSDTETGRTRVIVEVNGRAEEAEVILRRHGEEAAIVPAPRAGASETTALRIAEEGRTLQLREERLEARKQFVETGAVRVRKEAVTEYRTLEVPVQREEVVIERHAPTGAPAAVSDIGPAGEVRIPLWKEQVVVVKHAVVKEEVMVGKRVVQGTRRVGGEVRKEELRVEQTGNGGVHAATSPGLTTAPTGASAPAPRDTEENEEAEVRRRAYLKWLGEGCPSGQDLRHYFEASREVRA